ncbi:MAG: 2-phospho-L-lactate guanylyltransferase [Chloroflexi bacterium]|nr:2-phospho-L-lactate guanylyltransferase [Chloroflexota bacterium]
MSLWAIIPVKPLRRGKSRLAGVLSEEERTLLNYSMLGHTLKTLTAVQEIDNILVISRDPAALALAREYGAKTLLEDGSPHLNTALRRATAVAQAYSAEGILILPADLPLLTADDVRNLIAKSDKPPLIVISPDRRGDGTNALLVMPAGALDYAFGPGSFRRHCDRAAKFGLRVVVNENPSIGLDLDLPEDLELLRKMETTPIDIRSEL